MGPDRFHPGMSHRFKGFIPETDVFKIRHTYKRSALYYNLRVA